MGGSRLRLATARSRAAASGYEACCDASRLCQLAGCQSLFGTVLLTSLHLLVWGQPAFRRAEKPDYATGKYRAQKLLM